MADRTQQGNSTLRAVDAANCKGRGDTPASKTLGVIFSDILKVSTKHFNFIRAFLWTAA